ncbi:MAG: CoA pyrophosphatase [Chloroflexota bacterium]
MTLSSTPLGKLTEALRDREPARFDGPADGYARAAVLVLIVRHPDGPRLVYTRRTDRVVHHKGEVSFPGGACEAGDSDEISTALRETWEEIGVNPADVEVLGKLDEIITRSNFIVTPVVGVVNGPYPFRPNPAEVAEIIEVPIEELRKPENVVVEPRRVRGEWVMAPAYYYRGHRIFGATAMITRQLLELLEG